MEKENFFSKRMRLLLDSELQEYINNKDSYEDDAVQAAIWELEKRETSPSDASETIESIHKEIDNDKQQKKDIILKARNQITKEIGIPVGTILRRIRILHLIIDLFILLVITYSVNLIPNVNLSELFTLFIFPLYYIFFEYQYQKTPAKFLTGAIVVNKFGESPSLKQIILRTFARLIPFEPFSCLGAISWGWHDRFSQTYVIDSDNLDVIRSHHKLPSVEINENKFSKAGVIILVLFLVLVAGSVYKARYDIQRAEIVIKELDLKHRQNIVGMWQTNDLLFGSLIIDSGGSGISIDESGVKRPITYSIEESILEIRLGELDEEIFVIVDSDDNSFTLVSTKKPFRDYKWTR